MRCRTVSYKNTAQATETFKEPISPSKGIFAQWSETFKMDGVIPLSSDPMTIAVGFVNSIS